jgi:hypothetical protein
MNHVIYTIAIYKLKLILLAIAMYQPKLYLNL